MDRYPQLSEKVSEVATVLESLLTLRRSILDLESEAFDDVTTQGQRFYVGYVRLAEGEGRPPGLELVDDNRGVLSLCGLPFKIYRPNRGGRPGPNKTRVAAAEKGSLEYQTQLFEEPAQRHNKLLRFVVDSQGDPVALIWEEWEGRTRVWADEIYRASDDSPAVTPTDPSEGPPPVRPRRSLVTLPGDVVENPPDDDASC